MTVYTPSLRKTSRSKEYCTYLIHTVQVQFRKEDLGHSSLIRSRICSKCR